MVRFDFAMEAIAQADAMLITAGAGMGVDSGLPDFRGNVGFWSAYPSLAQLGLLFSEIASPKWFTKDPELVWGFFGHLLGLFRATVPHEGFQLLLDAAKRMPAGYFVVTSNIDGQFQKAGFDEARISEMHGSIHTLQCSEPCHQEIWSADGVSVDVDMTACRATSEFPACPRCGAIARPNILMFSDSDWIGHPSYKQHAAFEAWMDSLRGKRLVIIECGAGTAIPTIRWISSSAERKPDATLIRINPRDSEVAEGQISIPAGALAGISQIIRPA